MSKAKCFKCGASAKADTFEKARALLDHSIGLSRSIKCGDGYGAVQEIKPSIPIKNIATLPVTKKEEPKVIETTSDEIITKEEPKTTGRKSKNKKI